jgi:hypothetical protein
MKNNCIRKQRREHALFKAILGAGFLRRNGFNRRNPRVHRSQFRG